MAAVNDVSSSSKLWAVREHMRRHPFLSLDAHRFPPPLLASKEWVVPAKPKPGRKPKKDTKTSPINEETEARLFSPPGNLGPNESAYCRVTQVLVETTGKPQSTENEFPAVNNLSHLKKT